MTTSATALLDRALAAHGGLERWRRAREVVARARSGGVALAARWRPRAFRAYEVRVRTAEPRAVITPYAGPGRRGVFTGDRVRIESADGAVLAERLDPRPAFARLRRRVWWDDLDALYFGGYALWNYLTTPLLLTHPGVETRELEPWREGDEEWRRLRVRFPPALPTHCPEQVFYFDRSGLLRRHDYTALVFGGWARAAHYSSAHREFAGLVVPTRRRVLPRRADGRPRPFPVLVWIEVEQVEVVR